MGESPDLIDYTALEKRGLIKKKEQEKLPAPMSKDGFLDFSALSQEQINKITNAGQISKNTTAQPSSIFPESPSNKASSFTSFWDTLPGQTNQSTVQTTSQETPYYNSSSYPSSSDNLPDISSLKVKLEDLEYKLERLNEKLELITSKLFNFENKVGY